MVGTNPLNFEEGTKIQLRTKISDSETSIPELYQGEPLYNTNDNRLYVGPKYDEDNLPQVPDAKTTFMPMQGINDEYKIETVYNEDGTNDGIAVETLKVDATVSEVIVRESEDNPLATISASENKTSIHTADVQVDGDLNITGEGIGKVSFTNSGAVFVGDYNASQLHAGIRLRKGIGTQGPGVDIHSTKQSGEEVTNSLINLISDNVNINADTSITGSLKTKLDPMITTGETQPWYEIVGQAEGSTTRDLKYHGNVGLQHVDATKVNIKLPEHTIPSETNKYILGNDDNYFNRIHSRDYDIYDATKDNGEGNPAGGLVDLKEYIDDAISNVENMVTIKKVIYQDTPISDENVCTILTGCGVNTGDIGIIRVPVKNDILTPEAVDSYTGPWQHMCYVWNKETLQWGALDGSYSAKNVFLSKDILLSGDYTSVGNLTKTKTGTKTFSCKGMSIEEALNKMLAKTLTITSTPQPSVSYTLSNAGTYEVGHTIIPSFSVTYDPKTYTYGSDSNFTDGSYTYAEISNCYITYSVDAGANISEEDDTGKKLTVSVTSSHNGSTIHTLTCSGPEIQVINDGDDGVFYGTLLELSYGDGAVPHNNLGEADSAHQVKEASLKIETDTAAIKGYRTGWFVGTFDTKITSFDGSEIRSLPTTASSGKILKKSTTSYSNSKTVTFDIPVGAQTIFMACPKTFTGLKSVYNNTNNSEIFGNFTKHTSGCTIGGEDNYNPIEYDVWYFSPNEAYTSSQNITVSFG